MNASGSRLTGISSAKEKLGDGWFDARSVRACSISSVTALYDGVRGVIPIVAVADDSECLEDVINVVSFGCVARDCVLSMPKALLLMRTTISVNLSWIF